ncbi:MAG: hypothetical protein P9M14_01440 [Candidatus Alcyoniella australis]|nr:hypothetical protein [Candidatus Alcyoniella australis]
MPGQGQGGGQGGGGRGQGGGGRGLGRGGGQGRMGGQANGPGGACVCPQCGKRIAHQQGTPCFEQMCPDCKVKLVRG